MERHRTSDNHFSRRRKLPLPTLVTFLLNQVKGAVQSELDRFFQTLSGDAIGQREVTQSAFCQARRKFSFSAFVDLNQQLITKATERLPLKRWHGMRLLAVDGSKLRLPNTPAVREAFGIGPKSEGGLKPMALFSTLYDVLNNLVVDAQLGRYDDAERDLAWAHLDALPRDALVLFDRGYPAFWVFAALLARDAHFCIRLPLGFSAKADELFIQAGTQDWVTFRPSAASRKRCRELGLSLDPLRLRIVRVPLDSGETELLVTSLTNAEAFPASIFKGLYHLRWGVEEAYKRQKHPLTLENFSGKSPEAIRQDVHARVLTYNLSALLVFAAQHQVDHATAHRRYRYQVNWTRAFSKVHHRFVDYLLGQFPADGFARLIAFIAQDCEPIRLGRKAPRKPVRSKVNGLVSGYKPAC